MRAKRRHSHDALTNFYPYMLHNVYSTRYGNHLFVVFVVGDAVVVVIFLALVENVPSMYSFVFHA